MYSEKSHHQREGETGEMRPLERGREGSIRHKNRENEDREEIDKKGGGPGRSGKRRRRVEVLIIMTTTCANAIFSLPFKRERSICR